MDKVTITIDGRVIEVPKSYTVLDAARSINIDIPTLCHLKGINEIGACRICLVDINGKLQASCVFPVAEGMVIKTNTNAVRKNRKLILELILSNHDRSCLTCGRNKNCELQDLAEELNVTEIRFQGDNIKHPIDASSPSIVRDPNKCILCKRCESVCNKVQTVGAIGLSYRGFHTTVDTAFGRDLNEAVCIYCGQCVAVCPVAALREKEDIEKVWDAVSDPNIHVVVQTAPAVRVALGEEFGLPIGTRVTGKMVAALRRLGFDKIFDTDFAADLTIMEEGGELLHRIKNGGKLPLITSCSPGWIKFCEHNFHELLENLSTCKSPHQMMGAVIKSYYAEKNNIDPETVFVVSVMPCTAKKFEAARPELSHNGLQDVDAVITTRELAKMIKESRIDFVNLDEEDFDPVLGESTGAGVIFGATGGVMEAALRTVSEILAEEQKSNEVAAASEADTKSLGKIEFEQVRGIQGVKEAVVNVGGIDLKVAIVHGTGNARKVMEKVVAKEADYHFIEVMGCEGGCVAGGGQPIVSSKARWECDPRVLRAKGIYSEDESKAIRKSHLNPMIKKIYQEFLDTPGSHKAHELLHTHYVERQKI